MPLLVLAILLIGIPLIEIALFIEVGGLIGLWPTLLIVLATGIAGAVLLRHQGLGLAAEIDRELRAGHMPADSVLSALFIAIAGVMLLTPGFFTDTIGFLLFIPPIRLWVARRVIASMRERVVVRSYHMRVGGGPPPRQPGPGGPRPGGGYHGTGPVIEGEAVEVDPDAGPPRDDSPWRDER